MTTLDTLAALEAAATPGPWAELCESGEWWVEGAAKDGSPSGATVFNSDADIWTEQADINLMIAARNALPGLLRVAEAAQRLRDARGQAEFADAARALYDALEGLGGLEDG